jgi:ATP-dependent helicase HepA
MVVGQRWINEAELSLGLGTLVGMDERTLRVDFGAVGEVRTYARQSAALSRARFEIGERLHSRDGHHMVVFQLTEADGLITYHGKDESGESLEFHEMELSDYTQLNRANQRLFTGQIDKPAFFQLRQLARRLTDEVAQSTTRGLTGGRTSLIPHQLYIANEVAQRSAPRVLLADEVGLGKTIEAGLILNSRLIEGSAQRVLIVVPDHLVNQWLVEMLRRFNLRFSVFDRNRLDMAVNEELFLDEIQEEDITLENPFESEQLVLCGLSLFSEEQARNKVVQAQWDLLVVDEAHHLEWTPDNASDDYLLIEQLASQIESVLLLTATPEQLGKQGHFARLRLLDPARFYDYETYLKEEEGYIHIAEILELLQSDPEQLKQTDWQKIAKVMDGQDLLDEFNRLKAALGQGEEKKAGELREILISDLLDRHGTGRILFRNTRSAIKGFPERQLVTHELDTDQGQRKLLQDRAEHWQHMLTPEMLVDPQEETWSQNDPRADWLIDFLKQNQREKILVITAYAETALDLAELLRVKTGIAASVFHEGMSLIERDRAAAFFSDGEYGSPCLICSEIGSEGRNFQFAHQVVLFDLPANPDLLEQRIGRLDRIGQTETIRIHVPFMAGTVQKELLRFYHEALDAFEHTSTVALKIMATLGEELDQELQKGKLSEKLMSEARGLRQQLEEDMHRGRDHLLERNSCRMNIALELVEACKKADESKTLHQFMKLFCDCTGINYEEQTNGTVIMHPTESMSASLDGLPDEGLTLTYNREFALSNEDVQFFTWDHPVVVAALDRVLSSELGNTSLVTMKVPGVRPGTLMLETLYVLEPPHNKNLQSSRFLPASRIRLLLDHTGKELGQISEAVLNDKQQIVKRHIAAQITKTKRGELQALINQVLPVAEKKAEKVRKTGLDDASQRLSHEIERLEALQKVNPSVRDEEITRLKEKKKQILSSLSQTELALDAIRVVIFT